MVECEICGRSIKNQKGLGMHIKTHNVHAQEYYDIYLKQPGEGECPICGNPTNFDSINNGYSTYHQECINVGRTHQLSQKAKDKIKNTTIEKYGQFFNPTKQQETLKAKYGEEIANVFQAEEVKDKIKQTNLARRGKEYAIQDPAIRNEAKASETKRQTKERFERENNCIEKAKLTRKYGYGWYQAKILTPIFMNDNHANVSFYSLDDIPKIEAYIEERKNNNRSFKEMQLLWYIHDIYDGEIRHDCKSAIKRKEIDIYLPDLKLGVEFNGTYWHSIEMGTPKDYHLEKSLLCREKGIRLIHIYEFEDLNIQYRLLTDLINGVDNYSKIDFNKNNLIDTIPAQSEIIYQDSHNTIYGAGRLYM